MYYIWFFFSVKSAFSQLQGDTVRSAPSRRSTSPRTSGGSAAGSSCFESYIRDFTFVWLIPLSSWTSARRSSSAQPTFLTACRFRYRTVSFHSVSSVELRLAHHSGSPFWDTTIVSHCRRFADTSIEFIKKMSFKLATPVAIPAMPLSMQQ